MCWRAFSKSVCQASRHSARRCTAVVLRQRCSARGPASAIRRLAQARMIVAALVARAHAIGERGAHDRVPEHARDYGVPSFVHSYEFSLLDRDALR